MIQGIFYARFLPQEGTKIVAQSPPGCVVASPNGRDHKPPLLDFDIIQEYIIPRKSFFDKFMTVNTPDGKYSVLGLPVCIRDEQYYRNEFIFNFGLVVESDVDQIPYERLVRRLSTTFAEMERQNGYLSSSEGPSGEQAKLKDGQRPIESLLEIIKEDLNNYGECMIPVDEANTLNMKLFPYQAPPAPIKGWHVPVPKMKLSEIVDPSWDLTLQKIIPHIDGVNDVRRIAWLADVSLSLTQIALQHLLYYDTILLLDMFFFGSCYAPRPGIHDFITNRDGLIDECMGYVCIGPAFTLGSRGGDETPERNSRSRSGTHGAATANTTPSTSMPAKGESASSAAVSSMGKAASVSKTHHSPQDMDPAATVATGVTPSTPGSTAGKINMGSVNRVTPYRLIKLMTTFCVGRSVMEWIRLHQETYGFDVLRYIDVRRLVQFGVIKGLLYRVHKYAVSDRHLRSLVSGKHSKTHLVSSASSATLQGSSSSPAHASSSSSSAAVVIGRKGRSAHGEKGLREGYGSGAMEARRRSSQRHSAKPLGRTSSLRASHSPAESSSSHHGGSVRRGSSRLTLVLSDDNDDDEDDTNSRERRPSRHVVEQQQQQRPSSDSESDEDDSEQEEMEDVEAERERNIWRNYTDGRHCFDQIITEQNMTDAEVVERLRRLVVDEQQVRQLQLQQKQQQGQDRQKAHASHVDRESGTRFVLGDSGIPGARHLPVRQPQHQQEQHAASASTSAAPSRDLHFLYR